MSIRNKIIAAVLAAGALTGVASATALTAWASQPAPAPASATQDPNKELAAKYLAEELNIAVGPALKVIYQIQGLAPKLDGTPHPAFVAIAKDLGITPQRLSEALAVVKKKFIEGGSQTK